MRFEKKSTLFPPLYVKLPFHVIAVWPSVTPHIIAWIPCQAGCNNMLWELSTIKRYGWLSYCFIITMIIIIDHIRNDRTPGQRWLRRWLSNAPTWSIHQGFMHRKWEHILQQRVRLVHGKMMSFIHIVFMIYLKAFCLGILNFHLNRICLILQPCCVWQRTSSGHMKWAEFAIICQKSQHLFPYALAMGYYSWIHKLV